MNNRQNYRKARIRTVFDGFRNFGNEASSKYSSICNKTTGSYMQGPGEIFSYIVVFL